MSYPVLSKEQFYSKYDKDTYKFIPNCYNESDDSVLLYRDELLREKILIFQLPDKDKNFVPEHRKNLYILPSEDHTRLGEYMKLNSNENKKISAQLLKKFVDPYDLFTNIINKKIPDVTTTALDLGFDPFLTKALEYMVYSTTNKDNETNNLLKAKEFIEKKLNNIRRAKL
jgi:hypothetical protein